MNPQQDPLPAYSMDLSYRSNVFSRHARVTAALWFALAAYLSITVLHVVYGGTISHDIDVFAAAAAILPGSIFGARILSTKEDLNGLTIWKGFGWGAIVMLGTHSILGCLMLFSPHPKDLSDRLFAVVLTLVFGGWISFPLGSCAGALLCFLRPCKPRIPTGCGVHGHSNEPRRLD